MGRNWIIDVIADLHTFAQQNELPLLADELSKARTVAVVELSTATEDTMIPTWGDDADTERLLSRAGKG